MDDAISWMYPNRPPQIRFLFAQWATAENYCRHPGIYFDSPVFCDIAASFEFKIRIKQPEQAEFAVFSVRLRCRPGCWIPSQDAERERQRQLCRTSARLMDD